MNYILRHFLSYFGFLLAILGIVILINYAPEWIGKAYDRYVLKGKQAIGEDQLEQNELDKVMSLKNFDQEREKGKRRDGESSFYQKYW